MIQTRKYLTGFTLLVLLLFYCMARPISAQNNGVSITGQVMESGSGLSLKQVSISIATTGLSAETNEKGEFTIVVPDTQVDLIFNLPGYIKRTIYLHGRTNIVVYLVPEPNKSQDNTIITPLSKLTIKQVNFPISPLRSTELHMTSSTSFDQAFQGKAAGLDVVAQSGMPGHKTYMTIRGLNSLYGKSEPLMYVDGMIHQYTYATVGLMEGFTLNPLDIVDIDDITEVSVIKDGVSYLGSAGSNGVLNINTEQEGETSTRIKFSAYGGLSTTPTKLDVLDASDFNQYFGDILTSRGFSSSDIATQYPWFNAQPGDAGYFKYNGNTTDWQDEIFRVAAVQKYHFFLKGGDDIATYNISTGYLKHDGIINNSAYSRFNLRINGKINITDHFSVTPNVKLNLTNSSTPNMGYSSWTNPLISALLKPAIMTPYARDNVNGLQLPYLDDVGDVFHVSNPVAIVDNAIGTNINYLIISSIKAEYTFSDRFKVATLVGIDYNNAHEKLFLPSLGIVQVDSAKNSPRYFVNEFQSVQNHTTFTYSNKLPTGHSYMVQGGYRFMNNTYKYSLTKDLNTPSDEFKNLGQGSKYTFLQRSEGDDRGFKWISYFANANYNFRNRYFLEANLSYDASSVINKNHRYNFYPSVAAGWQPVSSVKVRGSWSATGNMFSSIYDYSNLYYISQRWNSLGVVVREAIPNEEMEIERKTTMNAGIDLTLLQQRVNVHLDAYQSNINNLLIQQQLPATFGFRDYVNNGGELRTNGLELSADGRFNLGEVVWTIGATITKQSSTIKKLDLINPNQTSIITKIEGGEMLTSVDNPANVFYGFKTDGLYTDNTQANAVIGPNAVPMAMGDVKFVEKEGFSDGIIDENDKMIIGDPNPDLFGGLNTAFRFKRLELSAQINYSIGNDVFNYVKFRMESMSGYDNQSVSVKERWNGSAVNADLPRISYGDPTGNTVFSDRWIEDGSYVRLKQLTLSYQLPKFFGIRSMTVYTSATNLLTFTKYSGYDPEFQYSNNAFYRGVDYGQMPQPRTIIMGVEIDL